jgi:pimeloyl-ACP methyl ester carboxylesterase
MRRFFWFLLVLALIVGGLEVLLYQRVTKLTHPEQKDEKVEPKDLLLSANDIQFTSEGEELHGWLILGKAGYPALIVAHDYGSNRSQTLTKLEGLITTLNKQGYFIFLFDFRGHGGGASRSTLGYKEFRDAESALKAVLKYKQIGRRVGVLGVGTGAVAASQAFHSVDEVKLVLLDSISANIPSRFADELISDYPFLSLVRPVLVEAYALNLKQVLSLDTTDMHWKTRMRALYPKTVVFIEQKPVPKEVVELYDAAREPKELLEVVVAADGELLGPARDEYNRQVSEKVLKYLPAVNHERTLELSHE